MSAAPATLAIFGHRRGCRSWGSEGVSLSVALRVAGTSWVEEVGGGGGVTEMLGCFSSAPVALSPPFRGWQRQLRNAAHGPWT